MGFFNSMSIRTRMVLGVMVVIIFMLVSNLVTQLVFNKTQKAFETVVELDQKKLFLVAELNILASQRAVQQRELLIIEEDDEEKREKVKQDLKTTGEEVFSIFEALNEIEMNEEELKIYDQIRENVQSANQSYIQFIFAIDDGFIEDAADILWNDFSPKYNAFVTLTQELEAYEKQKIKAGQLEVSQQQSSGAAFLWGLLIFSTLFFSFFGWVLTRALLKPVDALKDTMREIIETGDLTLRVAEVSKDELGKTAKDVNSLLSTIYEAIDDVNHVMEQIASGKFESRIEREFKGDFLRLKDGVNESAAQVFNMVILLRTAANKLKISDLDEMVSVDHVELRGDYAVTVADIDIAINVMHATLADISVALRALEDGDFSKRVTVDAPGEFKVLKDSINTTLDSLESFVEDVSNTQSKISDGDLTELVRGEYQGKMGALRDSLNASSKTMSGMIGQVGTVTRLVAKDSVSIAQGGEEIAKRIEQQTGALERTNQRMVEMTESVRNNAENARSANEMVHSASSQLDSGVEVMNKALTSMDDMNEASQKINDIIGIIDSIAFQTNLLALNAAVEAARAGEHGRGFAVVAGEVRALAGKSADAASEIKSLIENSVRISNQSGSYVKQVNEALNEINQSMSSVSEMVSTISEASSEQSNGIAEVSRSVAEMEESTQQNSSLANQAAQSGNDLKHQADELLSLVADFKVDELNGSGQFAIRRS